ncbi:protein of unknown function [Candidatus Methylomirabilis oxygeniifera]|uniref:Uncharacterized protein n=1 Tax=Methylomirabilis oxygeniifera TaxID=671143 RepID=D5MHU8_METO1|nr:protein of unknown function [Candidatus Methylomirabilis oxyfera]
MLACGRRECECKLRQVRPLIDLVVGVLSKRADLPCLAASGFFQAPVYALQCGLVFVKPGFMEWNGDFWGEQDLARVVASDLKTQPFYVLADYSVQGFYGLREGDALLTVQGTFSDGREMLV